MCCIVWAAPAGELMSLLPGSPSNSTVRTQLRVLESKGYVRHRTGSALHLYAERARHVARRSALKHLVDTFFELSSANVVAALLGGETRLSDEELERYSCGRRKEPRGDETKKGTGHGACPGACHSRCAPRTIPPRYAIASSIYCCSKPPALRP